MRKKKRAPAPMAAVLAKNRYSVTDCRGVFCVKSNDRADAAARGLLITNKACMNSSPKSKVAFTDHFRHIRPFVDNDYRRDFCKPPREHHNPVDRAAIPARKNAELTTRPGGNYGHHLGGAIGMGYVPCRDGEDGASQLASEYMIDVAGVKVAAEVSLKPMYDPAAEHMKS